MPGIFHQPSSRRQFLNYSAVGSAAVAVGADRLFADTPQSLHLALLSDTHVPGDRQNGHRGLNPWENLKKIVPEIVAARPEGTIINGDAARLDGKHEDYRELHTLLAPVAQVAPVYIGLGNHDDRANFFKTFPEPPGHRQSVSGKHVVVIEHPAVRILVLDSLLYVNKVAGLLGKSQREWLADYLPKHDDRPTALFLHHTLGDRDSDLLDADRLFALLEPNRHVKAIFYGHSHVWNIDERQGIKQINLPAVGYNFRDQDPVGWVDARFDKGGVAMTLRAFAGNRADDGKEVRVDWNA